MKYIDPESGEELGRSFWESVFREYTENPSLINESGSYICWFSPIFSERWGIFGDLFVSEKQLHFRRHIRDAAETFLSNYVSSFDWIIRDSSQLFNDLKDVDSETCWRETRRIREDFIQYMIKNS